MGRAGSAGGWGGGLSSTPCISPGCLRARAVYTPACIPIDINLDGDVRWAGTNGVSLRSRLC